MKYAHTKKWQIGEVIIGFPLLISILLAFSIPIKIINFNTMILVIRIFGIILLLLGLIIISFARKQFTIFNQPTNPGFKTTKIVNTGIYSISRNPLYLAAFIIYLAIGLIINSIWPFLTFIPTIILCYQILIKPEEKYLAELFNKEYIQYQNSVNRWIGRKK
jgi:protein-S-isoprenylcysteine O-methyltransferase Ste14